MCEMDQPSIRFNCLDKAIDVARSNPNKPFTAKEIVASARLIERYVNGKSKKKQGGEA